MSSSANRVRTTRRPRRLPAILAALAVVVLVLVGGAVLWQFQPTRYSATTTLLVMPQKTAAEVASYYDTLSRGQIAETFAQILALRTSPVDEPGATLKVDVVPNTSLIQVVATAPSAGEAERAADAALVQAQPYFQQLDEPYGVSVVQDAAGTAARSGLTFAVLAGVAAAVAVIAAIAAYLAVRALQNARLQASLVDGRLPLPKVPPGRPATGTGAGAHPERTAAWDGVDAQRFNLGTSRP